MCLDINRNSSLKGGVYASKEKAVRKILWIFELDNSSLFYWNCPIARHGSLLASFDCLRLLLLVFSCRNEIVCSPRNVRASSGRAKK